MSRDYTRVNEETGLRNQVQVKLDNVLVHRGFRNKGEAIAYLQKQEGLTRDDIRRRVRFIN